MSQLSSGRLPVYAYNPLLTGLVAHWPFDNGSIAATASLFNLSGGTISQVAGVINTAIRSQTTPSVSAEESLEFTNGVFSFSFWFKTFGFSETFWDIISKAGSNQGYKISLDSGGTLTFHRGTGSAYQTVDASDFININIWYHVIVTSTGATITARVSTVENFVDKETNASAGTYQANTNDFKVNASAATGGALIEIDELRAYNIALNAAQAATLWSH